MIPSLSYQTTTRLSSRRSTRRLWMYALTFMQPPALRRHDLPLWLLPWPSSEYHSSRRSSQLAWPLETTLTPTDAGNVLVGKIFNIHVLFCMFNGHADEVPISIELDQDILVDIACLNNVLMRKIDQQGIRVRKIFQLKDIVETRDINENIQIGRAHV